MGAPAARIPHSPPFSLPSSRGRGRELWWALAGDRWDFGIISSSLGRRNGIETNFIKQISLKRALSPTPALLLGRIFSFRGARNRNRVVPFKFLSLPLFLVIRDIDTFSDSFSQAQLHPHPRGKSRYVFPPPCCCSFPLKRLFDHEPEEHHAYSRARKAGHEGHDCAAMFAGCSLSLIDMALGKYDAAESPPLPPGYTDESYSYGGWARYNMK